MNSTLLRVLAVLLAVGAAVTAWMGYRLSTQPAPPPQVQVAPPSYPQVVAARRLPAGHLVLAEDVRLESLSQRDPNGYQSVRDVVGKLTLDPLEEGTPLLNSHFLKLGLVAQALRPGERAVAVKVNEVVGVGGFVSPGDHVDVLLYLRADRETDNVSSAQVVLRNVRVLAYGDNAAEEEETGAALPQLAQEAAPDKAADRNAATAKPVDTKKSKASKSAILAVPEQDASRLMLADSSGQLRLALRGAEPPAAPLAGEDASRFLRLEELAAGAGKRKPPLATTAAARPGTAATARRSAPAKQATVIVHRGDTMEVVKVAK